MPLYDELIRSRRRTVAILVQPGGRVVVRAPLRTPLKLIEAFVESKAAWIVKKKAEVVTRAPVIEKPFEGGQRFPFLGVEYELKLVKGQREILRFEQGFFLNENALPEAKLVFERWYRAAAKRVLEERVAFFAQKFGLSVEKIRISGARTRWGSCSSRGTLSFTWRLVMAPLDVVDYVVVHELAHLRVLNHSAAFWAEVARMMPDYARREAWLKRHGGGLTL